MKWLNNNGAATRCTPKICCLLVGSLALGWASLAQAQAPTGETQGVYVGAIQEMTLDDPTDVFSGGTITVGGQLLILPRNLLIDQPANRLTLQQMFDQAPGACKALGESGLAAADVCVSNADGFGNPANGAVVGAVGPILANRQADGTVIVGELWIVKGSPEELSGMVSYINHAEGYLEINGTVGTPQTGVMVRINDPDGVHTIQSGLGCDVVNPNPNCSPDTRFGLDPENYTITFTTGYPACIPSTTVRGTSTGSDVSGAGDALCPNTNRGTSPVTDSTLFAPILVGDHVTFDGNVEVIDGVEFISAHTFTVATSLTTADDPNQPDYMIWDEVEWDTAGFQNERVRSLMIGFTTLGNAHVRVYKLAVDPDTGENKEIIFASTLGCDNAGGLGLCTQQGIPPTGFGIFRIRYDIDFLEALLNPTGEPVKPKLSPCAHLNADGGVSILGGIPVWDDTGFNDGQGSSAESFRSIKTGCHAAGSITMAEEFGLMSPSTRELIGRTSHKWQLNPGVVTLDVNGNLATNGEYLTPVGIGHPEFGEINLAATSTGFIFQGQTWNLDRRTGPNGAATDPITGAFVPELAAMGTNRLDPFPCSGLDPRFQAQTPSNADRVRSYYHYGLDPLTSAPRVYLADELIPWVSTIASYETTPDETGCGMFATTTGGGGDPVPDPDPTPTPGGGEGDLLINFNVLVVVDDLGNWSFRQANSAVVPTLADRVTVLSMSNSGIIEIDRARFSSRKGEWRIDGVSNVPGDSLEIYLDVDPFIDLTTTVGATSIIRVSR